LQNPKCKLKISKPFATEGTEAIEVSGPRKKKDKY
jgi:hypothetical protein